MHNNSDAKNPFAKKSLALYIALSIAALWPAGVSGAEKKAAAPEAKPGIEAVKKDLKATDHKKRREALKSLGGVQAPEKQGLLREALTDEDPAIRENSARMIGSSKDASAFKTLSDALASVDKSSRLGLLEGLGDLGDRRAVKQIAGYLTDEDRNTRWKAAEVLGRLGGDDGVDVLLKAAREDKDDFVRKAAVESLGKTGTKSAAAALNALKAGPDKKIAAWAANVLKAAGK